jgi:hypothetical protein
MPSGRLLEFPAPQAAASVTAPWDPRRKFGAMVRRRYSLKTPARNGGESPAPGPRPSLSTWSNRTHLRRLRPLNFSNHAQ